MLSLSFHLFIPASAFSISHAQTEAIGARCAVIIMISRSGTKPFCGLVTSNYMCRTGVQSRFEAPHMPAANTRDSTRTEKARPPRCFLLLYKCINAYKNERDSTERGVKNRRNSSRSLLLWIFTCMLSAVIPYVFSVGVKDLRRQWRLSFKFLQLFQCCRDISIKRFYVLYLECLPHDFRNMAAPDLAKKRPLCVLLSRTEIIEQACIYWSKNINFNVVSNYDWRQLIKEKTKTSWQSVYI